MKGPQLTDCTQQAVLFTQNQALLASFMIIVNIQALFFVTKNHKVEEKKNKLVNFCSFQCHLSFITALFLSLWKYVLAISTETALYREGFNPYSLNLFTMLMKEFEYEFVFLRCCSLLSILSIWRGVILHVLLDYELLDKGNVTNALIVISASISEISYLVSYMNSMLHSSENLWKMSGSLWKVRMATK